MSSSISVPGYSSSNRVPGFYFALDGSKANTATTTRRVLLIGQQLGSSTTTTGVATLSGGQSDAIAKYGAGSQLARMVTAYRQIDTSGEVWCLPLADPADGKAAAGTITLSGAATTSGTLPLYVEDQLVQVGVTSGDTASTVAANAATALAAVAALPVTAAASESTINVTAKNKGVTGNDITLGVALLGQMGAQSIPDGLTVATANLAGGTGTQETLASVMAGLGDRVYDLFIHPYTDTASLEVFKSLFDNTTGRWSPMAQLYGHGIAALRGTYGQVTAAGMTLNDPHMTIMPISDSPSSPLVWAAQIGAWVATSMRDNPALPVTGLALTVLPPTDAGRFGRDEQNSLLYDGLSTHTVDDSGAVLIQRLITTYQTNTAGLPDDSYLGIETLMTAAICLPDMRSYLAAQVGGYILLDDAAKIPAGAKATTAKLIGKLCVARYRYQATQLWVQNADTFAASIVCQNAGNGVVKLLMPYDFANQLWVIAGNAQFVKS
ncbi:phage tail protein [Acetobacter tropicalis]|uniref:Bacteriophage tail sheath protein n=1 Tax=Acetobacter tropicalis TaxID=104102 RepID=A0A094YKJ6_9PROT|nr:phage tail sheath subtilisin-like domain-containing protein [Acetobacter tropicalis]KAA8387041.1 phage tail protein [Acetobacter tropicalis]KAA8391386.1 phage tail protein [Acetobacter tropicalis]KGB21169.1 Bacteriophage tail sheath protein [Acetobacter tropicalis]MBC9008792.1 phage tail sheath subtilisin-like domain-containing protein [Acetobacter tropicalis]MDO8171965.1 phage tail sheath subtilisin-like domain-containing protein [Acetobacter tropicalis]